MLIYYYSFLFICLFFPSLLFYFEIIRSWFCYMSLPPPSKCCCLVMGLWLDSICFNDIDCFSGDRSKWFVRLSDLNWRILFEWETFHFLLAISSPLYHVLFHWFVYDDYTMTSVYLIPDDILFRVETKLIILLGLKTVIFTFESLYYICIYIWNWGHHSFPVWSTMLRISSSGSPGPYRGSSDPK